jgi:hypothetical protein
MKRKIAAILAADVVGYSKPVAEDEEEQRLRRLRRTGRRLPYRRGSRLSCRARSRSFPMLRVPRCETSI